MFIFNSYLKMFVKDSKTTQAHFEHLLRVNTQKSQVDIQEVLLASVYCARKLETMQTTAHIEAPAVQDRFESRMPEYVM